MEVNVTGIPAEQFLGLVENIVSGFLRGATEIQFLRQFEKSLIPQFSAFRFGNVATRSDPFANLARSVQHWRTANTKISIVPVGRTDAKLSLQNRLFCQCPLPQFKGAVKVLGMK